jgi:hypothetical protein
VGPICFLHFHSSTSSYSTSKGTIASWLSAAQGIQVPFMEDLPMNSNNAMEESQIKVEAA